MAAYAYLSPRRTPSCVLLDLLSENSTPYTHSSQESVRSWECVTALDTCKSLEIGKEPVPGIHKYGAHDYDDVVRGVSEAWLESLRRAACRGAAAGHQ
jgi:hypothetical protein